MAGRKDEKMTLYHYTSKENAKQIRDSGVIQPSERGAYGSDKVYLTSKPPSEGRKAISENNFDGVWQARETKGFVDDHVRVQVPSSSVTKVQDPQGRDIYTHDGPLPLKK